MKLTTTLIGLAWVITSTAQATLFEYNFENTNPDVAWAIPDGDPAGFTDTHTVSGTVGAINNVSVTLNLSGGYNGDLYGYLVQQSADGSVTASILLNRVGSTVGNPYGSSASGMSVTLTGDTTQGYANIHDVAAPVNNGIYLADGRAVDPNGNVAGASSTAGLNVFDGKNANGTWTLFLADVSPIGQSTLVSWSLDISVVPEPTTYALIGFGLLVAATGIGRRTLRPAKVKIRR